MAVTLQSLQFIVAAFNVIPPKNIPTGIENGQTFEWLSRKDVLLPQTMPNVFLGNRNDGALNVAEANSSNYHSPTRHRISKYMVWDLVSKAIEPALVSNCMDFQEAVLLRMRNRQLAAKGSGY